MHSRFYRMMLVAAALAIIAFSSQVVAEPVTGHIANLASDWRARSNHPLVARVYATNPSRSERLSDLASFTSSVARLITSRGADEVPFLLLGELHDNEDHHRFRAEIIGAIASTPGTPPGVVFEQFRSDQQSGIDRFYDFDRNARRLGTAGDLMRFTEWEKSGWAKYKYEPLLNAVVLAKFKIYAGNVPREMIKKAAKEGEAAVTPADRIRLALSHPFDSVLNDAALEEIEQGHCGMMPKSALGGMAFAQRYRDAHLAEAMIGAAKVHGASILIAGNGHVRSDRGVPWYLRQLAPGKEALIVWFTEVEDGKTDPELYMPRNPSNQPAADFIVFAPAQSRDDPCEGIRQNHKPKP